MTRKPELVDDDGNVLPPPEPGSDVAKIIYLLEYGRRRGFKIGPTIQIGEAIVQVRDLRQESEHTRSERVTDLDPDSDMAKVLQQG